jgi:hypothetical protein
MKCWIKFVIAGLFLTQTISIPSTPKPQLLADGDPVPICDPTTQHCLPPPPVALPQ